MKSVFGGKTQYHIWRHTYCHESEFIKDCILGAGALSPKKIHDGMKGAQVAPKLNIFNESDYKDKKIPLAQSQWEMNIVIEEKRPL